MRLLKYAICTVCFVALCNTQFLLAQATKTQQDTPPLATPEIDTLFQEKKALLADSKETTTPKKAEIVLSERDQKFKKLMTGAKLTGLFTIEGKPMKDQVEDTYEIRKVEKAKADGDTWLITSRVKYGKNDYEMPFPIDVKWAGDTPVLTLEKLAVPGLGTFSCRVVLHGTKYAGTWQHDNVGGHMFGNIKLAEEAAVEKPAEGEKPKD